VSIEFLIRQQRNHVEQLSGVERSGNARGDSLIGCPIPNSSIEQWHMLVIVTGYTLFVASHHDVISTFANNVLLKFVDIICRYASILRRPCYSARTLFTRCCRLQCVTVMNMHHQRYLKK